LKTILKYLLVFFIGISIAFLYTLKNQHKRQSEQIDIINQGIKNVSKLVVTEASFSEIYNYKDTNSYFFDTFSFFEKKIILLVNAKIMVSYDLKKIVFKIDEKQKKLIIKHLPEAELTIIPTYKYYDIQQSMLNTFTKEELNKILDKSIKELTNTVAVSEVKQKAHDHLLEELKTLLTVTKLAGWTIEDQTKEQPFSTIYKQFKD